MFVMLCALRQLYARSVQAIRSPPTSKSTLCDLAIPLRSHLLTCCTFYDNTLNANSDGGLTPMHKFRGSRAILSGPAGGVVGYAATAYDATASASEQQAVIGLDMGGTSSDGKQNFIYLNL
jgi:Hydantoinase/oxoprolinase